jgi:molybdenum cofactor cytidylyltransferase
VEEIIVAAERSKLEEKKIAGVILSAGDSKRMGQPKALLTIKGETFLSIIIKNFLEAKFDPVMVILGNNYELIKDTISIKDKIQLFRNPNPEDGQLSSLQYAIKNLPLDCCGIVQALVDHPRVALSSYNLIFNYSQKYSDKIIIPTNKNRRGHPVYFGKKYFPDILNAPLNQGARYVVEKYSKQVHLLEVEDDGIVIDIDTPEEYQAYL